jgi:hypothetical protein
VSSKPILMRLIDDLVDVMLGLMSDSSPCGRKRALNKTRSESSVHKRRDMGGKWPSNS